MIGLFSKLFVEYLTHDLSETVVDEMLREVGAPMKWGFRENKEYPDEQWQRLFQLSCEALDRSPEQVEAEFARSVSRSTRKKYMILYQAYFSAKELMANLKTVRKAVIERHVGPGNVPADKHQLGAELSADESTILIHYSSPNKLCRFVQVLTEDVVRFYGDDAEVAHGPYCMKRGDAECEIVVSWDEH